ncbi:polysaccharide pyruvyl transferase [Methanobacterium lacus]|uniref:Polysaccharide pyruvyl transferase n=1 Tax=Methanobacterium lacus (strain AL-21) TaxID=877455 RepID=F0TBN5_METLA|nr:polysaccharide pyruvyl transferase family protein [Methanobacterium lacus]ADZ09112.1 polysaccharide pyruvyl transferase [Methanobacterium lacus]
MKILLTNVGEKNKGNSALIISTIETLKHYMPKTKFILIGGGNGEINNLKIEKQFSSELSIKKPDKTIKTFYYLFYCSLIRLIRILGFNCSIKKKSPLYYYDYVDVVINSGGDHFSGEYGIAVLNNFINLSYSIFLGKKVILYGESLGYYKNKNINWIARIVFNRVDLILVRDELSVKYLHDNHINNNKIAFTADPAFLLEVIPESEIVTILKSEKVDIKKPIVGMNPSGLISRFDKTECGNDEKIIQIFVKIIDYLIEEKNVNILLIPHDYTPYYDDRKVINSIFEKSNYKSSIFVINGEYDPRELKGIISKCDMFIGSRMHATIASTSSLVPTIGIAYSHKMKGIIGKMLGQEKYIIDINDFDYQKLLILVIDMWNNRADIKKELEIVIPLVKEKSSLNGKLVKELIMSES